MKSFSVWGWVYVKISSFNFLKLAKFVARHGSALQFFKNGSKRRFQRFQPLFSHKCDEMGIFWTQIRVQHEVLAEALGITPQAISKRVKAMGMIQKQGKWVPYVLKPRNI